MRQFVGKVLSNKMTKSVTVAVTRLMSKPGKYNHIKYQHTKKFMAHDEKNECNIGDIVRIQLCRPLSKNKSFTVTEILQRAKIFDAKQAGSRQAHTAAFAS
uniref:Small subunit ribosomal protein S17 n=1 Tax=Tetraselmis sp. GSL018 TaxID=582737 RepID=A0A061QT75_9CHLO